MSNYDRGYADGELAHMKARAIRAERERDTARAALDLHLRKLVEVREFAENLRGYGMDKDDNLALALLAILDGEGEKVSRGRTNR